MFSTTALAKSSKFTGKIVGTHQRLDQAARRSLGKVLPRTRFFPTSKEIIYFEGTRGPDGLKNKSPGIDEPSHMLTEMSRPSETDHGSLDTRSVVEMIIDHRWNLVRALKKRDQVRAAFEAAWMAHMITDGLTPAHHFPLADVKEELMTDKDMLKIFGQPIKGLIHGRNLSETMRNNWLYWGAGGQMSKHIAYEYGVLMITAAAPPRSLDITLTPDDLQETDTEKMFAAALQRVQSLQIYKRFCDNGWTTELATETKEVLLPEIVRAIALGWYSAATEVYKLKMPKNLSSPRMKSREAAATEDFAASSKHEGHHVQN